MEAAAPLMACHLASWRSPRLESQQLADDSSQDAAVRLGCQLPDVSPLAEIAPNHKSRKTTDASQARRYRNDEILQISKSATERRRLPPRNHRPQHQRDNSLQSNEAQISLHNQGAIPTACDNVFDIEEPILWPVFAIKAQLLVSVDRELSKGQVAESLSH
jgi:hypothetical protein